MLDNTNKQPISIGILEISAQNRAVLEYFFSAAGKSCFKEVSADKASSFIIDYDAPGAKDSWQKTFQETNKPGIIISIKEIDLPSTIWIPKPLTVKALTEAGLSIRELLLAQESDVPAETTATLIDDKQDTDVLTEEIQPNIIQEDTNDQEVAKEATKEIAEELDQNEIQIAEDTSAIHIDEESVFEESILEDIIIENFEMDDSKEIEEELDNVIAEALNENIEEIEQAINEPELAIAGMTHAATPSSFAVSSNLINADSSLNDFDSIISDIDTKIERPIDEPEIATANNPSEESEKIDELLATLISGGKKHKEPSLFSESTKSIDENNLDSEFSIIDINNEVALEVSPDSLEIDDIKDSNILLDSPTLDTAAISPEIKKKSAEEELQSLLEEIRQEAGGLPKQTKAKSSQTNGSYAPTNAEQRWKLTCGTHKNTDNLLSLCSYKSSDHMLATLLETIGTAKLNKQIIQMKFKGFVIVICPKTNSIFCDETVFSQAYADICHEKIKSKKIKIHNLDTSEVRLYQNKMDSEPELTHSIEAFIWTTSLLTSRGRLPVGTDINQKMAMKFWPDLTRVEKIPNAMRIAAAFHKGEGSLVNTPQELGIPQKHVIAFYNALLSLDIIKNNGTVNALAQTTKTSIKTKGKANDKTGFFSRILKRLTS